VRAPSRLPGHSRVATTPSQLSLFHLLGSFFSLKNRIDRIKPFRRLLSHDATWRPNNFTSLYPRNVQYQLLSEISILLICFPLLFTRHRSLRLPSRCPALATLFAAPKRKCQPSRACGAQYACSSLSLTLPSLVTLLSLPL
jgi:hypothetical protein